MKKRNSYIAGILFVLLLLGSAGVLHFGMGMEYGSQMTPCPFSGEGAICNMNPLEHIAAWQNAFIATFQGERGIALLLLAFAAVWTVGFWKRLYTKRAFRSLQKRRHIVRKELCIVSPLQEAFSNGILNPKVF